MRSSRLLRLPGVPSARCVRKWLAARTHGVSGKVKSLFASFEPSARSRFDTNSGVMWEVIQNRLPKAVARPERFELPTLWFEARCSIQLSYGRVPIF